jgi:hypothetical protein
MERDGAPPLLCERETFSLYGTRRVLMNDETKKTRLPLALELAEPKLIAGEVDIQLSSRTNTKSNSQSFNGNTGLQVDVTADVTVDDVIA